MLNIENEMDEIIIKNRCISKNSPVFFLAEIGINHNGSLKLAKQLIDMASMLGCDAVKFQKRTPDICVPEDQKNIMRETPWGDMTYLEYKKKIEFEHEEYSEIDKYCKDKDILWTASVWDLESFDFIEKFNVPFHKIASAKITDRDLLEKVKATKKPVFLSTGGSTMQQVKKAVNFLESTNQLVILHCNSGYPSEDNELNLNVIKTYQKEYPDKIIGYSGHERGITASIVSAVFGAKVIERHITLDRTLWGTDQAASLEYDGLKRLLRDLGKLPVWLGDGKKVVFDAEKKIMEKLRDKSTL